MSGTKVIIGLKIFHYYRGTKDAQKCVLKDRRLIL